MKLIFFIGAILVGAVNISAASNHGWEKGQIFSVLISVVVILVVALLHFKQNTEGRCPKCNSKNWGEVRRNYTSDLDEVTDGCQDCHHEEKRPQW